MIITEQHSYQDGDTQLKGYLAYDDSFATQRPAVIIAPEAPGIGDHVRMRASMFAKAGFIALVADLYGDGRHFADMGEMMAQVEKTRSNLQAWRQRTGAALVALKAHPLTDKDRLCAVGYCFGGSGVLELARSGAPLRGTVCFHGELTPSIHDPKGIGGKILVLTGASDPFIPLQQRTDFEAEMQAAGAQWEMIVYGGAKHGFTNPEADLAGMPGMAYDTAADRRSWQSMMNWLGYVLA